MGFLWQFNYFLDLPGLWLGLSVSVLMKSRVNIWVWWSVLYNTGFDFLVFFPTEVINPLNSWVQQTFPEDGEPYFPSTWLHNTWTEQTLFLAQTHLLHRTSDDAGMMNLLICDIYIYVLAVLPTLPRHATIRLMVHHDITTQHCTACCF